MRFDCPFCAYLRLPVFFLFFALLPKSAYPQTTITGLDAPRRDPAAVAMVESALAAMGGRDSVTAVKDSFARVEMLDPAGSGTVLGECKWKNRLPHGFRYECPDHAITSHGHTGRPERQGAGSRPLTPQSVATDFPPHLVAYMLLQQANDRLTKMIDKGTLDYDGSPVRHIELVSKGSSVLHSLTRRQWYFDAHTSLPVKVEIPVSVENGLASVTQQTLRFTDFKVVQSVGIPFSIRTYIDSGPPVMVASIKDIRLNLGVQESELAGGAR